MSPTAFFITTGLMVTKMANTKRIHFVTFGPPIPVVPTKDFTKMGFKHEELKRLWEIIGPSVERNMNAEVPMWQIITMAYLEGLNHGSGLERERISNPPKLNIEDHFKVVPIRKAKKAGK